MNVINTLDPDACVYDVQCMLHYISMILDPDTCMYDAYCIYIFSPILDPACVYDAHIYDPGSWSWIVHVCVVRAYIYDAAEILLRTNEQGDSRS